MLLVSATLALRQRSSFNAVANNGLAVIRSRRLAARWIGSSAKAQPSGATALYLVSSATLLLAATYLRPTEYNNGDSVPLLAQCAAAVESDMLSPSKEPSTGILFPRLCNGMTFAGCGCRVKYGFVKVYAVGSYFDPLAMSMIKNQGEAEMKKALLDTSYPRTIRIVMNRNLSIDKYTSAIIEALEPRMNGLDDGSIAEFKKLNPPVDLIQGAVMEMTIRGDTLLYKNAVGGLGQIKSAAFTKAMCDVFYGNEAVSPPHVDSVLSGIKKM